MPAPAPTPLHLKLLRGNPGRRPLRPEPEPARDPECPDPPAFVTGYASDEWWRVGPQLHRLGLLTVVDIASLAAYCVAYGDWRTAREALARMAEKDPLMHGLLVKTCVGDARRNPLVKIAADAASDMLRYAAQFGLTPVARARIAAAGIGGPPSGGKFDGLLG